MNHFIKKTALLFILLIVPIFCGFCIGAGAQLGVIPSAESLEFSAAGTMRLDRIPIQFAFGLNGGSIDDECIFGMGGSVDFIFLNIQIINNWNFYSAAGLGGDFYLGTNKNFYTSAGLRALLGMDFLFMDGFLQLYFQQVIEPCFVFKNDATYKNGLCLKFPIEAGLRFQF